MFTLFLLLLCQNISNSSDTRDDPSSIEALELLENIDDDLDRLNVAMVKVRTFPSRIKKLLKKHFQIPEKEAFSDWGVTDLCSVFYFENGIPNIYSGTRDTYFQNKEFWNSMH